MKRNFITLIILILAITISTAFMITGCKKEPEKPADSSVVDTGRKSNIEEPDGSSIEQTSSSEGDTSQTGSDDTPTSSDDPGTTSSDDGGNSSTEQEVRPSDTPIYNSGN